MRSCVRILAPISAGQSQNVTNKSFTYISGLAKMQSGLHQNPWVPGGTQGSPKGVNPKLHRIKKWRLQKLLCMLQWWKKIPFLVDWPPSMFPGAFSSNKKTQNVKFLLIPPTDFGFYFIKSIHFWCRINPQKLKPIDFFFARSWLFWQSGTVPNCV